MMRDVANALARSRRDLRIVVAGRYRALLRQRTRFVVVAGVAAVLVDSLGALARALREVRTLPVRVADRAVVRWRTRRPGTLTVVRAAVGGTEHLSVCLAGEAALLARLDGLRLERHGEFHDLDTTVSIGATARLRASLPAELLTGEGWTLHACAGARPVPLVVADRRTVTGRTVPPCPWPPWFEVAADRTPEVHGTAPAVRPLGHHLVVGVRTAVVRWDADGPSHLHLVAARPGVRPVVVEARVGVDGALGATVDLAVLAAEGEATWSVHAGEAAGSVGDRRPVQLSRTEYPRLNRPARAMRAVVPGPDGTGISVEVGYAVDNRLVVRVGDGESTDAADAGDAGDVADAAVGVVGLVGLVAAVAP